MKKYIFANWKCNPKTSTAAQQLAKKIKKNSKYEIVLFPPSVFLPIIKYPKLGSQDCFWEQHGPYTGQVSPSQLKSLKVSYCLVGHSELRTLHENNDMVALKVLALLSQKITPVLCVGFGSRVEDNEQKIIELAAAQIQSIAEVVDPKKIIVAYEPVWAISKGDAHKTKIIPTPEHVEHVITALKKATGVSRIIYGGSVTAQNAKDFLHHADGLLIGASSLKPKDFNQIITNK